MKKSINILLPAFNEEKGVTQTIKSIPTKKLEDKKYSYQILVIDNNSSDNTSANAQALNARVVTEKKQGYGYAYKKGFSECEAKFVVCMDSDGTYPGNAIIKIVELLEQKYDFVIANRFHSGYPKTMHPINVFGNRLLTYIIRFFYKIDLQDSQSGMWGIKGSLLHKIILESNDMGLSQELKIKAIHQHKARWKEIPIKYSKRVGKTKLHPIKDGPKNLFHLIKLKYSILF